MENLPPFSERNGSGIDDNIGINGSILRQAVEKAIDIVDASTLEVILENLTKKGVDLDNPSSRYTLEQLETALTDIFGLEAGPLLLIALESGLSRTAINNPLWVTLLPVLFTNMCECQSMLLYTH
jgi:hypothetical protein